MPKLTLTQQIILGMVVGAVLGFILNQMGPEGWHQDYLTNGLFDVGGKIFVRLLKMLVVPLVLVSLICGTSSLADIRQIGRIGGKTIFLYMVTTAIAITIALVVASIVNPGSGFDLVTDANFNSKAAPPLSQVIVDIFPENPIRSMSSGSMLQIIFTSILFGLAMAMMGEKTQKLNDWFNEANEVILKMVTLLMVIAPIGVFCLVAKVFAAQGFDAILPLLKYFLVVLAVLAIHGVVVYPALLKFLAGLNPVTFFVKFKSVMMFAFSTSSSNATIPVTLEKVEHDLGVKNSVASFTIPLGATINMDGTAIMQGVATVFIAQAYGIQIPLSGYLMVILTATLASIGTAGVPGVGLVTLAMVLKQAGLPEEGIGLIIGVDRLLDMTRTAVNVTGDAAITCIVAKSEGQFDQAIYDSPDDGD